MQHGYVDRDVVVRPRVLVVQRAGRVRPVLPVLRLRPRELELLIFFCLGGRLFDRRVCLTARQIAVVDSEADEMRNALL